MTRKSKKNSMNQLAKKKKRVIKELQKSGRIYRKARKEFGKNDPLRKKKYNSKKPKRGKKLKCFSRVNSKNKRYVTCIKMKTKGTRGGKLPLSYFGAPIHKNFSKKRNMCFHL
jgi:hypothetical protein